jgi:hypothetical protein
LINERQASEKAFKVKFSTMEFNRRYSTSVFDENPARTFTMRSTQKQKRKNSLRIVVLKKNYRKRIVEECRTKAMNRKLMGADSTKFPLPRTPKKSLFSVAIERPAKRSEYARNLEDEFNEMSAKKRKVLDKDEGSVSFSQRFMEGLLERSKYMMIEQQMEVQSDIEH